MENILQRRRFLQQAALAVPALGLVSLDDVAAPYAPENGQPWAQDKKLGIALLGLGKYSEEQLAPALEKTQRCRLAGIITGTPEKVGKWKERYKIPDKNIYNYQNMDSIRDNPDIDIVYVVTPNALHAEHTIRAAKAGKHVICEKPMATSVEDCEAMIAACKNAGKMLSIGYRLHFEPHHQTFMQFGKKKLYGDVQKIVAENSQEMEKGVWRLDRERSGGGPLMDLGIYCVQGALYSAGANPVKVAAKEGPKTDVEKFAEVEQSIDFQLEFPGGAVANCRTAYVGSGNRLRVEGKKGWYELEPAYEYKGIKGKTSQGPMGLENVNQQALQMDDFANCVLNNKPTRVPGEMGLRDVKILMAIYEAARTAQPVTLKW
ncbi:Gfo/Idh/MocA family protein [Dyadobacter fermentans]|uniref:Oxidoreductase domain protein n=1 Tax=Dyadobacter fermentans (strain ATCC 700827 / DSM 18053 / CIP 107007 / KCTC 52180 / NS114) TaxID=471854 RepID=C6W0F9_DYAFD|nr:Gfo/Idh/MocA family oxidoreductase [Dyadobacter fermentans]ACT91893.1 oxidoreductase domain protein [Dyadobacter fermentans DSM 18053]